MLKIVHIEGRGVCFADVPLLKELGAGKVFGPIMTSFEEASGFVEWLREMRLQPSDLSDSGLGLNLTLYREESAAIVGELVSIAEQI